jgi:hypothetical protein
MTEETEKQLIDDVKEIKLALLGDFRTRGFITDVHDRFTDVYCRVTANEKFRKGFNKVAWLIVGALVVGLVGGWFTHKFWA